MNIVELHQASDRRCYNGAYCSDLQKEIDSKDKAREQLKKLGISITYFPYGDYYIGFYQYSTITKEYKSFNSCYYEIINILTDDMYTLPFTRLSERV